VDLWVGSVRFDWVGWWESVEGWFSEV
jgi:hypothetical protein